MSAGNLRAVSQFIGPKLLDPRRPLLDHLCQAFGGIISDDQAIDLLNRLAGARDDPVAMRRILDEVLGDAVADGGAATTDALQIVLRRVFDFKPGVEVAWLPLEAMIKVSRNGLVQGFKGPPELNHWFERWKARRMAEGVPDANLTPENFIDDMRMFEALETGGQFAGLTFKNADAQEGYARWVLGQVRKKAGRGDVKLSELTRQDFEKHTADTYRKHIRPGMKPFIALANLFGPGAVRKTARNAIRGAPGPNRTNWGKVFQRVTPKPEPDWKDRIKAILSNQRDFAAKMEAALLRRFPDGVPSDLEGAKWEKEIGVWVNNAVLHHIKEGGGQSTQELSERVFINNFIGKNLDGDEGDAILKALLGPKNMRTGLHSEEFVDRVLDCYIVLGKIAVDMNIPWAEGVYAGVGGMFELIQMGISRSGTPRAYAFELEAIFTSVREFLDEPGIDIILQFKIGGASGPDMLLVTATMVRIRQMKSYASISVVYGWSGEAARQTGSDLSRFIDEFGGDLDDLVNQSGPLKLDVDLGPDRGTRELHSEWTFFIDGRREELSQRVVDNMTRETKAMNEMFQRTGERIDDSAYNTAFMDFCLAQTGTIVKNGPTIGDTLLRADLRPLTPPLSIAEVAILRLFLHDETGTLTDEALDVLIKKARVAARFDPPLRIVLDPRTKQHLKAGSFDSPLGGVNIGED